LTDARPPRAYLDGTQREVSDMNGMLQHHDYYRDGVERRQQEAREWAQVNALGRLSRTLHDQYDQHPVRTRVMAVASPLAIALGVLAILI